MSRGPHHRVPARAQNGLHLVDVLHLAHVSTWAGHGTFFAARASAAASSEPGGVTRAAPDAADFADFDLLVLLVVPMVRDRRERGRANA